MAANSQIPSELRDRIQQQRKRQRLVRFSFAITAVITVLLLFGVNQAQNLAPTARNLFLHPTAEGLWVVDQHLDFSQQGKLTGSFAILRIDDGEVLTGTRYDGLVAAATLAKGTLGVTAGPRFLEFDLSKEDWPRTRLENLQLNDPSASAVVLNSGGTNWLCWTRGAEIMVKPIDHADVEPHSLHQISAGGATLGGVGLADRMWLSVLDKQSNELTLVAFRASITDPPPVAATPDVPADSTTPARRTRIHVIERSKAARDVRRSSLAILQAQKGDVALLAWIPKEDRGWRLSVRNPGETDWREQALPERGKPSTMELNNFTSLATDGDAVLAAYNDGTEVKLARGAWAPGGVTWDEPATLPIDPTQGPAVYIIWLIVLCGVLLLMASQGVWLLLNRERPGDHTLAVMLERKIETDTTKIRKPEPKLLYASGLARGLALFVDIAVTSPAVILLQDVYDYTWEQAYGFLAFGSVASLDGSLIKTLLATIVTLLILVIYGTIGELFWGKTFGKALLRLRVVDRQGEHPTAWRVVVRNAVKIFELIHFLILLVPMVLMMMSGRQQRLGDLLAGTYVIVDAVPDEAPDDIDI
jgi:uncharacterized RDD family membrane protein YckC